MSVIRKEKLSCAICGNNNEHYVLLSTNSMGPSDLDGRPAGMARGVQNLNILLCSNCNYANSNIRKLIPGLKSDVVFSDDYKSIYNYNFAVFIDDLKDIELKELTKYYQSRSNVIDNKEDENPYGRKYMLASYLYKSVGDYNRAGCYMLQVAWSYDDVSDSSKANCARVVASHYYEKHLESNENIDIETMLVDIYRRIGLFDKAKNRAKKILDQDIKNKVIKDILEYQIELCRKNNTRRYSIGDIDY